MSKFVKVTAKMLPVPFFLYMVYVYSPQRDTAAALAEFALRECFCVMKSHATAIVNTHHRHLLSLVSQKADAHRG